MEILYKVHHGLYVNLTNKCPCACTFCLRQTMDHVGEAHSLWLEREPSAEEVIAEFAKFDMNEFEEVVFCGFGEPTEALPVLLKVAAYVKETFSKPVRINTNGMGNLIWNRDITPEFEGLIDTVSISLNTPNPISFAKKCTQHVPKVVMTTVATTITKEEETQCSKICEEVGAVYRIRPWED